MKFDPSANVTASTIASRCALLLASSSIDGHGNLQQNNTQRRGASDPEIEAFPSHDSLQYLEFTSLQVSAEKLMSVSAATFRSLQIRKLPRIGKLRRRGQRSLK
jgi:hypothetical protein